MHPSYRGPGSGSAPQDNVTLTQMLNTFAYDVAILRLSTTVTNIRPLPVGAYAGNQGNQCTIVGFGQDSGATNPGILRKRHGAAAIRGFMGGFTEVSGNADPALGDSGGPLVCDEGVVRGGLSSFYFKPDSTRPADRDFYVQTHDKRAWVNSVATRWGVAGIAQ